MSRSRFLLLAICTISIALSPGLAIAESSTASVSSSDAARISVLLTGRVSSRDEPLRSHFLVGDRLDVIYAYYADAPAIMRGVYPLLDFAGTLGGYRFGMVSGEVSLLDNSSWGDQIWIDSVATGPAVGAAQLEYASAFFRDLDRESLMGEDLIARAPDLGVMEQTGFALLFEHPVEGSVSVRVRIGQAVLMTPVDIDIKPGSDNNSINPFSPGAVRVAIFGSEDSDVTEITLTTLAFGPSGAPLVPASARYRDDLNADGFPDLLAHFRTEAAGIAIGDTEACLRGEMLDGTPFIGCDAIRTVPQ